MINPITQRLSLLSLLFVSAFLGLISLLYKAEMAGLPPRLIGYLFLLIPVAICAVIGAVWRTSASDEQEIASPHVPAAFAGMANIANWLSAAGFIGLAGVFYSAGLDGIAYLIGWIGGYLLLALVLAPRLRRSGQTTITDFLLARYRGRTPQLAGVGIMALTSFVYLLAQIYVIGLIVSHFAGLRFEAGVFVGLAGVLMCSFLGGVRSLAWGQVIQFLFRALAYLIPIAIVSWSIAGHVLPQLSYASVLQNLVPIERKLVSATNELAVQEIRKVRAETLTRQLAELPESLNGARSFARARLDRLLAKPNVSGRQIAEAQKALRELPKTPEEASKTWSRMRAEELIQSQPLRPFTETFASFVTQNPTGTRNSFLALILVLILGTAGMPHILTRCCTIPGKTHARKTASWTLFLILLLLLAAPAYAVFAKWQIYTHLVGTPITDLPHWISSWSRLSLIRIEDINRDEILQLAELSLNPDVVVLALPEMIGLPYIMTGLLAAGALGAALTMADSLLQTISASLSEEFYFRRLKPAASTPHRLVVSKTLLLLIALLAGGLASLRLEGVIQTVGFAFSIAASGLFPPLILGLFWPRANQGGATTGMICGLALTLFYAAHTHPLFGGSPANAWFGIQPIAGGIFGVLAGFTAIIVVSLISPCAQAIAAWRPTFARQRKAQEVSTGEPAQPKRLEKPGN